MVKCGHCKDSHTEVSEVRLCGLLMAANGHRAIRAIDFASTAFWQNYYPQGTASPYLDNGVRVDDARITDDGTVELDVMEYRTSDLGPEWDLEMEYTMTFAPYAWLIYYPDI